LQGFVLSRCDGGSEGSGNSVCRDSLESEIFSRGEVGSIGDGVRLVEVEMVEILVRVSSCKKDAYDKKYDGCD
jgi:hypothetical protein